ncbi:MAG: hypothetical protein PHG69_00960 [Candidatus Omnitrophica bacterium]|nr:hypothetical protein [Candidatus Omnitrophota bacterium]
MKVLVVIRRSPAKRFLVDLHTNSVRKEVANLLAKKRNSQAIATTLAKGRFDREVLEHESGQVKADIIITEEGVHWDLTK